MQITFLSDAKDQYSSALPSLDFLAHTIIPLPLKAAPRSLKGTEAIIIDGTSSLVAARNLAQLLKSSEISAPILLVLTEGGMAAVSSSWMVDDVVLNTAGPAELEARLRLLNLSLAESEANTSVIRHGAVSIDEASYTARLDGAPLNLTYKEFELLKFLTLHSGRVFTRSQLLSEVWGYDYYGGTRTVDVHIRRLRSKLGAEHEHLISTVRNVGYSFNASKGEKE